jgi:hypothetical protein
MHNKKNLIKELEGKKKNGNEWNCWSFVVQNLTLCWKKKMVMYHNHGVLVSLLSALIMNKNMEAKTSRLPIDKKLIRYE